ncbi:MAG: SDR family oxidoreductase [Myxococcales bacterium]
MSGKSSKNGSATKGCTLLTGFPSNELACFVLARLLESEANSRVICLVPARFTEAAESWLSGRAEAERTRVELLEGDVASIDMGLSGAEYRDLMARARRIHHCAAVTYSGAPLEMAEQVNVGGAHEVLELGRAIKRLERIVHWSTLSASGDVRGVISEGELVEPNSTRLLHTRYRAEKQMWRARSELPITVLRPALLVGDRERGALRRVEGLHLLIAGVMATPRELPLPVLGSPDAPLQAVPIDYAVEAGLAIARAKDTVGRTFHLVESAPPTLGQVFATLSDLVGRPAPVGAVPLALTRMLTRLPGLHRLVHAQRALLEEVGRSVRVDDSQARRILARAGLVPPPLLTHLPRLVQHVAEHRGGMAPRFSFAPPAGSSAPATRREVRRSSDAP